VKLIPIRRGRIKAIFTTETQRAQKNIRNAKPQIRGNANKDSNSFFPNMILLELACFESSVPLW
jgi:hypothetical protein